MNCAYHSHNVAVVNCNGCGKPLCPSCDHRVKGFPFCQDCIVSGVEMLRQHNQSNYAPFVKKQTSPVLATVLSLVCPGLGAAYNGQTVKALVHFALFVGLFQMAVLTGGTAIFVLGFIGMWLFAALDSWRTAQIIRSGVTPDVAEDILVRRFSGNPKLWGIVLTVLGISFFLNTFFSLKFFRAVLPVFLIGLGIYLLRDYIFKTRENNSNQTSFEAQNGAPNFVTALSGNDFQSGNYDAQNDLNAQNRIRNWKNR